jgi:hypothetical protein
MSLEKYPPKLLTATTSLATIFNIVSLISFISVIVILVTYIVVLPIGVALSVTPIGISLATGALGLLLSIAGLTYIGYNKKFKNWPVNTGLLVSNLVYSIVVGITLLVLWLTNKSHDNNEIST